MVSFTSYQNSRLPAAYRTVLSICQVVVSGP